MSEEEELADLVARFEKVFWGQPPAPALNFSRNWTPPVVDLDDFLFEIEPEPDVVVQ